MPTSSAQPPVPQTGPLISVVLPVYGVHQYLTDCLDSILHGDAGLAIEVIAVDDASPDGCGVLLDRRASTDNRLTVVHLDQTSGPGNARNVGLARATGQYVWFVDGDDLLASGALAAVGAALAAYSPDVLLFDYQNLYPGGSTGPSYGTALLRAAPTGLCTLADAPELIELTMTSWSKVLRRDFLVGLDQPFRNGIHEDVPVTCAALLAGRLAAMTTVCYCYRRSRRGSFMATTSTGHAAIFASYSEVFDLLAKRVAAADPVATPAVQVAVFERAIWHYTALLQSGGIGLGRIGRPGLVPRSERRAFFRRMHADFVEHRPAGYRRPHGARGAKFALIERDAYWTYEVLEPVNRLRIALRGSGRVRRGRGRGPLQ
jgi:glycosyltransferase involved in cell wall biosynthesis